MRGVLTGEPHPQVEKCGDVGAETCPKEDARCVGDEATRVDTQVRQYVKIAIPELRSEISVDTTETRFWLTEPFGAQ